MHSYIKMICCCLEMGANKINHDCSNADSKPTKKKYRFNMKEVLTQQVLMSMRYLVHEIDSRFTDHINTQLTAFIYVFYIYNIQLFIKCSDGTTIQENIVCAEYVLWPR